MHPVFLGYTLFHYCTLLSRYHIYQQLPTGNCRY